MPKDITERTLIGDYHYPKFDPEKQPSLHRAGRRLPFSARELDHAVKAGVVHADEKMDAEVPVNDPQGNVADEQTGSGPAPDARLQSRSRKKAGDRYSKR